MTRILPTWTGPRQDPLITAVQVYFAPDDRLYYEILPRQWDGVDAGALCVRVEDQGVIIDNTPGPLSTSPRFSFERIVELCWSEFSTVLVYYTNGSADLIDEGWAKSE